MFDKFESRLVVRATLAAEAPVRVSAGRDREIGGPDLPVVKDSGGRPYIPGSTIRGRWRAFAESLLRGAGGDATVCEHGNCRPDKVLCMSCAVFGSRHVASHITFFDAQPVHWFGQLEIRAGLPVNRDSGKGDMMAPWEQETISAGTRFHFRAELTNGTPWMRGLVHVSAAALADGLIWLGAGQSRGTGLVKAEGVEYFLIDSATALISRLGRGALDDGDPVPAEDTRAWTEALKQRLSEVGNAQAAG